MWLRSLLLFPLLTLINRVASDGSCTTPSNQAGTCKHDVDCPAYKRAHKEYFASNLEYFRKLECNYKDSRPTICCPNSGEYIVTKIALPNLKRHRKKLAKVNLDSRFGEEGAKDECGKDSIPDRIIGGEIAEIDEFPWMALLFYKNLPQEYKFGCGGALIDKNFVLTAAHCVSGSAYELIGGLDKVRLGEYNVLTEEDCVLEDTYLDCADPHIDLEPVNIILHPSYNPASLHQRNDIALIKLSQKVEYTYFISPICIPKVEDYDEYTRISDSSLFVAGWGRDGSNINSPVKLKVKVPMVGHDMCTSSYRRFGINPDRVQQLCAGGENGKDSCKGDSGGPLMAFVRGKWISIGIVSIGPNACGTTGIPGIYTNVSGYVDWIKDSAKD